MNIKELREKMGITQEKMAAKLGVSLGSIRGWEYGNHTPSPMAQFKIEGLIRELDLIPVVSESEPDTTETGNTGFEVI
jgi:transcriptional regulator with XRE-family HTH domain